MCIYMYIEMYVYTVYIYIYIYIYLYIGGSRQFKKEKIGLLSKKFEALI